MRTPLRIPILTCLFIALMSVAGSSCKKSAPASPASAAIIEVIKLQQAFPTPGPDVQRSLEQVTFGVRYGDYNQAVAALDKLAATPNLTDAQKKTVGDVTEQVKKASTANVPR